MDKEEVLEQVKFLNKYGVELDGTLFKADNSKAGVICLHGFGRHGNEEKYLALGRALEQRGVSTLTFSFTGWGLSKGSTETLSLQHMADDCEAAISYLKSSCGAERLGAFTHSFGAIVLGRVLFSTIFDSMVLMAPALAQFALQKHWFGASDLVGEARHAAFEAWLREPREKTNKVTGVKNLIPGIFFWETAHDYTPLLQNYHSRILHVHGVKDFVVPIRTVKQLWGCRTVFLESASHDLESPAEIAEWMPNAVEHLSKVFSHS